jgi:hypothetical protein
MGIIHALYADVIFQLVVKKKGPQRNEALKEFSKYARAQVEQVRQTEKVRCDCEQHDKSSHFSLLGCCRCERTHHGLQGFATTQMNQEPEKFLAFTALLYILYPV